MFDVPHSNIVAIKINEDVVLGKSLPQYIRQVNVHRHRSPRNCRTSIILEENLQSCGWKLKADLEFPTVFRAPSKDTADEEYECGVEEDGWRRQADIANN